jgi:hypothetical protein
MFGFRIKQYLDTTTRLYAKRETQPRAIKRQQFEYTLRITRMYSRDWINLTSYTNLTKIIT